MPDTIMVLTGPLSGRTVRLSHHNFTNGEMTLKGGVDVEGAVRYLGRCYQAFPKGSEALKKAQEKYGVQRDTSASTGQRDAAGLQGGLDGSAGPVQTAPTVQRSGHDASGSAVGAASLVPGGSGHENSGLLPEQVIAIRRAVAALDPLADAHWSEEGKPSIETMAQATGIAGISRQMIDAVAPDVTRESAADI